MLLLLSVPTGVAGQSTASRDTTSMTVAVPTAACANPVRPDSIADVMISQRIAPVGASFQLPPAIATFDQRLAERVRIALGGAVDSMPYDDALGTSDEIAGVVPVVVVFHRGKPPSWRIDSAGMTTRRALADIYTTALRDLSADPPNMKWPDGLADDSIEVSITLVPHRINPTGGKLGPIERLVDAPVLWMHDAVDADQPPLFRRPAYPRLPRDARHTRIQETVVLEAIVDAKGRVDAASIRDVPELAVASDSTHFEHYHAEFVAAARQAISDSWFFPARASGCAVAAMVRLPYAFGYRMPVLPGMVPVD